jgi:hypothetical protein
VSKNTDESVCRSRSVPGDCQYKLWHDRLRRTPRLAPFWAGVSPGIMLAVVSCTASLSGAFVATSGSAMIALDNLIDRDDGVFHCYYTSWSFQGGVEAGGVGIHRQPSEKTTLSPLPCSTRFPSSKRVVNTNSRNFQQNRITVWETSRWRTRQDLRLLKALLSMVRRSPMKFTTKYKQCHLQ